MKIRLFGATLLRCFSLKTFQVLEEWFSYRVGGFELERQHAMREYRQRQSASALV